VRCKKFASFRSSLAYPFDEDIHDTIDEPILFDKRKRARDQQRCDAVDTGPERLRHFLHILAVQLACFDTAPDCRAEVIKAALAGFWLMIVRNLFCLHERANIVIGIVDAELYVGPQATSEA
jgi:hypothetical protein